MSDVKELGLAREILKILKEKPRQTPQSLLNQTNVSMSSVRNNLMVLSDLDLIEAKTRGLYEITSLGKYLLDKIAEEEKE